LKAPSFILSGITILLMDGFFLVRTGLSLIGDKTTEGADYGFYRRFPMNQLFAGFFSGCARNELMPLIYCSVAAVFFALVFLISGKAKIREKLADIFVLGVIAVSMWINTFDAVWHGFNNPEGFYFRYAFLISFMVIVMGYRGAVLLTDDETAGRPAMALMAGGIMFLYMIWLKISGNIYLDTKGLIINAGLVFVIMALTLIILRYKNLKPYVYFLILLISAADMLYNSQTAYTNLNVGAGEVPQMSRFKEDYTSINDVISYIKGNDSSFYRIEKDFDRAVNDPALFDYAGMSHDSSCEKDEVIDWLNNFGFPRTVYYTYYNGGGTSFTDSFFGIKYYVSRFDEIAKPYTPLPYTGKYHAYMNEYALPIVYMAPEGLSGYDLAGEDTFKKQNALAAFWGTGDEIYREAEAGITLEGLKETEEGHYVKESDKGYLVYDVKITEDMPLYVYFTAPARQGAELFINGEDRGRYFSENHWNIMHAGNYKKGDRVEVKLELLEDELTVTRACFYYEDAEALKAFDDRAYEYNRGLGEVEEISSSHLKFNVSKSEDGYAVASVPYDKCWRVTCDGKKLKTDRAVEMLMSFEIPKGEHIVEMKYIPRGTYAGLIASAAGVIMFIVMCFTGYRRRR
ncbi:MAG: YfhO family protein, partial [Lachnospiraceae bacterium]|nr:YfhO family protein [Lachnospiraceae bacterium]